MIRIIRAGLAATLVVSALSSACSSDDKSSSGSPEAVCNETATVFCSRLYECATAAEIQLIFGYTSEAQCVSTSKMEAGCDSITAENACEGSQKYHHDQAEKCVSQFEAATCAQIQGEIEDYAPACTLICTVP